MIRRIVILFCVLSTFSIQGQTWEMTYALKTELGFNFKSKTFVSMSAVIGVKKYFFGDQQDEFYQSVKKSAFVAFQSGFNLYYNGLGDNILDNQKKLHLDLVSSMFASMGMPTNVPLRSNNLMVKPFHSFMANAVYDEFMHSLSLGTNAVLNFEGRNQILGFFNLNVARVVRLGYYNDGPPFGYIGFGDRFDRWWTGGGHLSVFLDQGFRESPDYFSNSVVTYDFDRFTGDVQSAYEVSGTFGFKYVPAQRVMENYFNRARGKFSWKFFRDNTEYSIQYIGYLSADIQDFIHRKLDMPYHMTYAQRYFILGLQNNFLGKKNY